MTHMTNWTEQNIPDQTGRVAIVTGANSGLGFETAHALAAKGATVVLACRNQEKAQKALAELKKAVPHAKAEVMPLDLADLTSVRAFAAAFQAKYSQLNLLINNAGVMMTPQGQTKDGFETQFGANHLGHFALTGLLMPVLRATPRARVVNVSSMMHLFGKMNFDDLQSTRRYNPSRAYGQSKLANLLFTRALNEYFRREGISAVATAAHPGWASTNLQAQDGLFARLNPYFAQDAASGALPTLYAATMNAQANDFAGPSQLMGLRGSPQWVGMSKAAQSDTDARRLWQVSQELTGVWY